MCPMPLPVGVSDCRAELLAVGMDLLDLERQPRKDVIDELDHYLLVVAWDVH